jgi:hypothetical protein
LREILLPAKRISPKSAKTYGRRKDKMGYY